MAKRKVLLRASCAFKMQLNRSLGGAGVGSRRGPFAYFKQLTCTDVCVWVLCRVVALIEGKHGQQEEEKKESTGARCGLLVQGEGELRARA